MPLSQFELEFIVSVDNQIMQGYLPSEKQAVIYEKLIKKGKVNGLVWSERFWIREKEAKIMESILQQDFKPTAKQMKVVERIEKKIKNADKNVIPQSFIDIAQERKDEEDLTDFHIKMFSLITHMSNK